MRLTNDSSDMRDADCLRIAHLSRRTLRAWTLLAGIVSLLATGCGPRSATQPEVRIHLDEFATRIASLNGRAEVSVDLGFTDVTDDDLASLTFPDTVTQIDLRNTKVTDEGLVHLKKIRQLEKINLAGTRVSDAGVAHLLELPNLYSAELQNSLVSSKKQLELYQELIPRQQARSARRTEAAAKHPAPY